MEKIDSLFINCRIACMTHNDYTVIENGAIAVKDGKIKWTGKEAALPEQVRKQAEKVVDCDQQWILPGFIDCHTHLVWGGSRSDEFEMRLNGVTYEEIARKGGGIASTVLATRHASEDLLFEQARKRVACLFKQGVTTLEIKSGYGLDLETELKILRVIDRLNRRFPICIAPTFLGAHALPPEFRGEPQKYIDLVTNEMLPAVRDQGIATAVDVFCENIGFSVEQTRQVFEKAVQMGFDIKLHAEQLSDSRGALLASQMGALSCDHLEYLGHDGALAMARNNVTAVLLPGAFYFLRETRKPPVPLFRDLNIPMAVSTDLNPGSSPVHSISVILNMACQLFHMTPLEALLGVTLNAARALGITDRKGSIEPGKDADFVLWDIHSPADLCYLVGYTPINMVVTGGNIHDLKTI